jgi:hypothetical protein
MIFGSTGPEHNACSESHSALRIPARFKPRQAYHHPHGPDRRSNDRAWPRPSPMYLRNNHRVIPRVVDNRPAKPLRGGALTYVNWPLTCLHRAPDNWGFMTVCGRILRKLAAHQDSRKCQVGFHWNADLCRRPLQMIIYGNFGQWEPTLGQVRRRLAAWTEATAEAWPRIRTIKQREIIP